MESNMFGFILRVLGMVLHVTRGLIALDVSTALHLWFT
jgi:hypothetical protein